MKVIETFKKIGNEVLAKTKLVSETPAQERERRVKLVKEKMKAMLDGEETKAPVPSTADKTVPAVTIPDAPAIKVPEGYIDMASIKGYRAEGIGLTGDTLQYSVVNAPHVSTFVKEKAELPFIGGFPSPDLKAEINLANEARMQAGKPAFVSVAQYERYKTQNIEPSGANAGFTVIDGNVNPKTAKSEVFFVASQGYYLMRDGGKVYFQRTNDFDGIPVILRVTNDSTPCPTAVNSVTTYVKYREMTQAEMNAILASKPSADLILGRYAQYFNEDGVLMNLADPTTIW